MANNNQFVQFEDDDEKSARLTTLKDESSSPESPEVDSASLVNHQLDEDELPFFKRVQKQVSEFRAPTKDELRSALDWFLHPGGITLWQGFKQNWRAGVTVSLVNVPLSISLAIAGGGDPVRGIATAFWAGLVCATMGGSHFNIVGPTGALSGVLAAAAFHHTDNVLPLLAIISGIMVMIVWAFNLDKFIMFIPSSVEQGFTLGVAILIAGNQFNSAFGLNIPSKGDFISNMYQSFKHLPETNLWAFGLFAIQFTALFLLVRKWPKLPWSIIIAMIGILVGFLTERDIVNVKLTTLNSKFPGLKLNLAKIPHFTSETFSYDVFMECFTVSFIAILETLISARIADSMTKTNHDQRREVMAVGIANIVTGIVGGMPATAALARTALNINNGATNRMAGIINCIFVLILSLVAFPLFKYIPMPTVAALLVLVAYRMVSIHHIKHMFIYDKMMFLVLVLCAFVCVYRDTMEGIMIGAVISLLIFADKVSTGYTEIQLTRDDNQIDSMVNLRKLDTTNIKAKVDFEIIGNTLVYYLVGHLTYINGIQHFARLQKLARRAEFKACVFSFRFLDHCDLDGFEFLEKSIHALEENGKIVSFCNITNRRLYNTIIKHKFYQKVLDQALVFSSLGESLKAIPQKLQSKPSQTTLEVVNH